MKKFIKVLIAISLIGCGDTMLTDRSFFIIAYSDADSVTIDIGPKRVLMPPYAKAEMDPLNLPSEDCSYSTSSCPAYWQGLVVATTRYGRTQQQCSFYGERQNDLFVGRRYDGSPYINC